MQIKILEELDWRKRPPFKEWFKDKNRRVMMQESLLLNVLPFLDTDDDELLKELARKLGNPPR